MPYLRPGAAHALALAPGVSATDRLFRFTERHGGRSLQDRRLGTLVDAKPADIRRLLAAEFAGPLAFSARPNWTQIRLLAPFLISLSTLRRASVRSNRVFGARVA